MKGINKKGFTLIELLAVIVVLAIVMVLAATTVLPYMATARKDAFAVEANTLREAAAQAMSLNAIGSLKADYITKTYTGGYCFTLKNLKDAGLFTKNAEGYDGIVVVKVTDKAYTYTVTMKNSEFIVKSKAGEVTDTDVATVDNTEIVCPTAIS